MSIYALIKCVTLAMTFVGYAVLFQKKSRLEMCVFPVTALSGMTLVVYAFGMAGLLKLGCLVVTVGGLLSLARYGDKGSLKAIATDAGLVFCAVSAIWLFAVTRGVGLSHYDDATHWYRICKAMNYEGAFPTTPDISFYTYVPGAATWIYYVTRFTGFDISNCLFAHNLINIACVASLFSALKAFRGMVCRCAAAAAVCAMGVLLCGMNFSTYTLLVDAQIGLLPMAAWVIALGVDAEDEAWLPVCLVLTFSSIVKNSGLLFAFAVMIFAGARFRFSKRKWLKAAALWGAPAFLAHRAYFLRAALVYGNASGAEQNMAVGRFLQLYRGKSYSVLRETLRRFLQKIAGESYAVRAVYLWAGVLAGLCLIAWVVRKRCAARRFAQVLACGAAFFVVYCAGLLGTYFFSMTMDEALMVAQFDRYFASFTIFFVGAAGYVAIKNAAMFGRCGVFVTALVIVLALTTQTDFSKKYIFGAQYYHPSDDYTTEVWDAFENDVPENRQYVESRYVVLWNREDFSGGFDNNGRVSHIAKTWLRAEDVIVIDRSEIRSGLKEELLNSLNDYDYLVSISDMSEEIGALSPYLDVKDYHIGLCEIGG